MFGVWHLSCLCPVSGAAFQQNDAADGNWAFHCTNGEWDTNPYTLSLQWLRFVVEDRLMPRFWPLLSKILYTGIVIYAPALALNQGESVTAHRSQNNIALGHEGTWTCNRCFASSSEHSLTACSFCSNRHGPVGGSHFHWCGVYLLLYNGRWLRQFKSF